MTPKTRKALEGSITKWRKIVKGATADLGPVNCPLCKMFAKNHLDPCHGCPVREKTGRVGCLSSPYENWADYWCDQDYDDDSQRRARSAETRALAQAELDFLISLRPKKKRVVKKKEHRNG